MAVLYILQTHKGGYYVGSTLDLDDRLRRHARGMVRSTRALRPIQLVYQESFPSRGEAQRREYEIKRWKSKKKIQNLIHGPIV